MVKFKGKHSDDEVSTHELAPVNVDAPYVGQEGSALVCTMGNWDNEPTAYAYQWHKDGTDVGAGAPQYMITPEDIGTSFDCTVTASNTAGEDTATSVAVVVLDPADVPVVPTNPDELKTYQVVEDNTVIEIEPGVENTYMKGDTAQISYARARELIDSGVRIIGTD